MERKCSRRERRDPVFTLGYPYIGPPAAPNPPLAGFVHSDTLTAGGATFNDLWNETDDALGQR